MRFGIFGAAQAGSPRPGGPMGQGFHDFIDFNVEAEALGYHSTFLVAKHHFTGWNQVSATLTLLTWLAARTTTLRLGTAVMVLPWHNPVILAEQAATLDLLSEGRLDFGVGKGYRYNEFTGFAIPLEEANARFEERLRLSPKHGLQATILAPRALLDVQRHPGGTADQPKPAPTIVDGRRQSHVHSPRGRARLQSAPRPVRSVRRHRRPHCPVQGRARGSVDAPKSDGHCPCARHACRRQPGHQGRRSRTQSPVP